MKTTQAIVAKKTARLTFGVISKFFDSNIAPLGSSSLSFIDIGSTNSTSFVPLFTSTYTIDTNGKINVFEIRLFMRMSNDALGGAKLQISGDGGSTFVDVTNEIGGGAIILRIGPGLWINKIDAGLDKFQIRVLGRDASGIGFSRTFRIRADSFIDILMVKEIV